MPPKKTEKKEVGPKKSSSRRGRVSQKNNKAMRKAPKTDNFTVPTDDVLRLAPLGGLEEIGRNMTFFEYKDEIVVLDMGLQFPEEDTPGIDFIIPNIESLVPKKKNIRAVVITHGHYDHIGAIPYLIGKLGNPPIYTLKLTKAVIERRQEEFVNAPKLNIIEAQIGGKVKVGKYFELDFFGVEHTIPDAMGIVIKTPIGNIVSFGDFRLDRDSKGNIYRLDEIKRVGAMGIHTLMIDSTSALKEGIGISEKDVEKNLEKLLSQAEGRIVLATFSSMLTRIGEIIKIAEKLGRKVAINGRSMKQNVQIAQQLGYMKFKKGTIISVQEIGNYKDSEILVLSTGAQGEQNAGLMRIANGEHRHIQIKKGDTFIFSSSVIPGNERHVQTLTDNIARQGAIVHNSQMIDIHSSGHAPQEDLKIVMKLIHPKFLMPIHAYYYMRYVSGRLGVEVGIPEKNIRLLDNGSVGLLTKDEFKISDEILPTHYIMVDGLGVGDVEEVVIRDRKMLSEEGMIVIIATLNRKTGRLIKNPDIISRGFIYLREHQGLIKELREKVRNIVGRIPRQQQPDADYIKALFRDQVGQFVYNKTHRRPMILPVIIEV